MIELLRLIGIILAGFFIYKIGKYYFSIPRKLEAARIQGRFLLLDDPNVPRKNFLLTFKGAVFEGEKYLGLTDDSFAVISISIWLKDIPRPEELSRKDFIFIQNELLKSYPKADIEWAGTAKGVLLQEVSTRKLPGT
ncbi:sigma-w pathway protein ysdB [Bacillus sp. B-jedd]|uniref:sigma-w pathway protein ysdB n=1 Tax=Bacillus sp. B-jedd TaxID=1476857 RepID=UPI0005155E9C|nr:sigma-w pathway protein ysdB [Bacillus sp. B-jedd]CEG28156.1 YsdB [Bacillus sp. B-jedd]